MSISRMSYKVLINWVRIICFLLLAFPRGCRKMTAQTCLTMRVSALKFNASFSRRRKISLLCALCVVIFLLFWLLGYYSDGRSRQESLFAASSWLSVTQRPNSASDLCINYKLEEFRRSVSSHDAVINRSPLGPGERYYPPFMGNGYIGALMDESLYVKYSRALSVPVDYYPTVLAAVVGVEESSAVVINIIQGLVHKIQCFQMADTACISITSIMYADRRRPSILIQRLRVHNPTDSSVTVYLRRKKSTADWKDVPARTERMSLSNNGGGGTDTEVEMNAGQVNVEGSTTTIAVVVARSKLLESVVIEPGSTWTAALVTVVQHRVLTTSDKPAPVLEELEKLSRSDLRQALELKSKTLTHEHTQVWNTLWSSGFGISKSLALGALNGDQINMTMYYLISNVASPIYEVGRAAAEKSELERSLYFPDRCYEGHHTLQNSKMWRYFYTVEDIVQSVNTWLLTLEKQGCANMLRAGADGVIQAMMLSYGALRFSNDHLEFGTHPSDLHRDYFFRRINYGNDTHVNISVVVNEENKAMLYVSLDRNNRPYYACDAGCMDTPIQLSREVVSFPVKLTDPFTSILYITADKQHMEELKHAIHLRDIFEAPAHEHGVLALHRHGHSLGGLPVLFWASIGALIMVFHLFLFKLVYNEYCSGNADTQRSYPPAKYPQFRYGGRSV